MQAAMNREPLSGLSLAEAWADVPKVYLDVEGDFSFRFDCPRGHSQAFCLNVPHHELLFDAGAMSLERGAYREAVFSFAASRERFAERYLKVIAHARCRDFDAIESCWKALETNSERQIGAFFWLGLVENGVPPEGVQAAEDWASFRNRVVHRGVFPSRQQTMDYGQYLWTLIRERDAELRAKYPKEHEEVSLRSYHLAAQRLWKNGYKGGVGGMSVVTVLGGLEKSFEASLARFRQGTGWATRLEDLTVAQVAERLGIQLEHLVERLGGSPESSE
jgi:hypothetical protein